jgi:predicted RNase H-like nuclease (RuvC/YqgF family)
LQTRLNEKNGEIQQLKNNVTHHKNELRISIDRGHRVNSTHRSLRKQLDEKNQEILKLKDTLEAKFLPSYLFFSQLTNNYSIAMSTIASVEAVV